MKRGEHSFSLCLDCGVKIRGMFASQIEYIKVEHENEDITPSLMRVKPKVFTFKCKLLWDDYNIEKYVKMRGTQVPLISNSATTGHKLQGATVQDIFVNDVHYGQNWPYVVLSRVKTMEGLILHEKLKLDINLYKIPDEMKCMIADFNSNVKYKDISEHEYNDLITTTNFHNNMLLPMSTIGRMHQTNQQQEHDVNF